MGFSPFPKIFQIGVDLLSDPIVARMDGLRFGGRASRHFSSKRSLQIMLDSLLLIDRPTFFLSF